jgi:sodium transport system permease protein
MRLFSVFDKEMRDSLRDRRTVLNALIMGPVLGPVLFVVLFGFITGKEMEKAEETLEIPVVNAELAPNLVQSLQQNGMQVLAAPDDPEQSIADEAHDVIIRITDDYPQQWRNGEPAVVELLADRSRREVGTTITRVQNLLNGYGRQIGAQRIQLRGVDPALMQAVMIKEIDLSTPESRGALILAMLPYFIMIGLFVSGMSVAIDTTAGEKERKSLEPLLINPLPRWQIMAGKLLATTAFTLISLALTLVAFVIGVGFIPAASMDFKLNLDWGMALQFWLLTAPVALIAGALLTILAAFAKSFREAQSYMGFVIFIPMLPTLWMFINPVKPELWMMAVPLLSQSLLINETTSGNLLPLDWQLLSVICSLLLGLLLAMLAASLYSRPKLIFSNS